MVAVIGCLGILVLIVIAYLFQAAIVYGVWNLLVVSAFNVGEMSFEQAVVVVIVLSIVGGFFKTTVSTSSK